MSNTKEMSKRQARREQIRRKEQRGRLISIGFISLGALIIAFLFVWPNFRPVGDIFPAEQINRPIVDFNTAGDPAAPIKIEEYGDFQCPHCRTFYTNTERQLMETYVADGTVHFVYHSFGAFIGPESASTAEAAYCAGDQNKFWEMHDLIFANQLGENQDHFNDRFLLALAENIGLDMGQFRTCFNGGNYADLVEQDEKDGIAAKIQATPSFIMSYVVNGETKTQVLQGAQPYDVFKETIDAALAEIDAAQ
jgi:protein-disulfide isomerase